MIKILFVCHGNICRSPMAEFVMKAKIRSCEGLAKVGLSAADFEVASAATSTEEIGNPVYPPARRMLASHGIDCSGKRARQMTADDYMHYDYLVLMDQNNLRNLRWILSGNVYGLELTARNSALQEKTLPGAGKVSLLMDWAAESRDVADPWYTGDFEATWQDVNQGCEALLDYIIGNFK